MRLNSEAGRSEARGALELPASCLQPTPSAGSASPATREEAPSADASLIRCAVADNGPNLKQGERRYLMLGTNDGWNLQRPSGSSRTSRGTCAGASGSRPQVDLPALLLMT